MAKKDPLEDKLELLSKLRQEDDSDVIRKELKTALTQKRYGLLVSKAADLVAELGMGELSPQMEEAFHRLSRDPLKKDKGCAGKTSLVKALVELEQPSAEVFLAGARYVQLEPVWGGTTDTAAQLRGWCAHGLVRMRHPEAVLHLTRLLVDPERPTRLAAVDALGDSGQTAAEALLRLKVLVGDDEVEVVAECFNSLLRLEPHRSLSFVGDFLASDEPAIAEGAALALGDSRSDEAVDLLVKRLEITLGEDQQRSLYLALALTRRQRALDLLIDEVEQGPIGRARSALKALALNRHDESLRERLRQHLDSRRDRSLEQIWHQDFED